MKRNIKPEQENATFEEYISFKKIESEMKGMKQKTWRHGISWGERSNCKSGRKRRPRQNWEGVKWGGGGLFEVKSWGRKRRKGKGEL